MNSSLAPTELHNEQLTRAIQQAETLMQSHGWSRLHLDDDSSFMKTREGQRFVLRPKVSQREPL